MRVIFDDMGYLRLGDDGVVRAYGTEIGAFVRTDDLDPTYAFSQLDRGIYTNPDKVNARVTIPIATYELISKGFPVDYFLYANNYEDVEKKISLFSDMEEAIKVFKQVHVVPRVQRPSRGWSPRTSPTPSVLCRSRSWQVS